MNKFEGCEDNSSTINLNIKSEIDIKDDPFNSDDEYSIENHLNVSSEKPHIQSSGSSMNMLNSQMSFNHNSVEIENDIDEVCEEEIVGEYKVKEEFPEDLTENVYEEESLYKIDHELPNSSKDIFSSRLFDCVSRKMDREVFGTDVQEMGIEHVNKVNKEFKEHDKQHKVRNINLHMDKKSFYLKIQESQFPKVLVRRLNISHKKIKIMNIQKNLAVERGLLTVPLLESLNSFKKKEDERNEKREDDHIKASSISQEKSDIMKKFRCSVCEYKTNHKRNLKNHLLTHLNTKLFKCPECNYECNQKGYLSRHLLTHSNTKLFKCPECNYECNQKVYLSRHLLTHSNTKLFKCPECSYECNRKEHLSRHLLTHSNTKLFKCSVCNYEFNRKEHIKSHLLTHSNTKLFKCSECSYACNYKSVLKIHLLNHSNTKLFKCFECSYACNYKGDLKKHLLTHSNTKLFKCFECSYACNYKRDLKIHLLTHSNTKLFKCSECSYECNRKRSLNRHLLVHY